MKRPKKPPAAGAWLPHAKMVRMSDADVARLEALAKRLEMKEAGVLRVALRELAKREGLE